MRRQDRDAEVPSSGRRVEPVGGRPLHDDRPVHDDPPLHDDTAEIGVPVLVLGPGERWVLEQVRRHGVGLFVATMSLAATVATSTIVALVLAVRRKLVEPDYWIPGMAMAVVVPILIAPPLLLVTARLVARLDTAMQLLRSSAVTDPLTGVANRRGFFAGLARFADERTIEVAMVDLDSFKSLNDRYGHATGDAALRAVATWLVGLVGDHGIVGRVGGDEFAVAAADAFGATPSHQRFELGDVSFTVSIGRAIGSGSDTEAALLAADQALYEQKRSRPNVRVDRRPPRAQGRVARPRRHVEP